MKSCGPTRPRTNRHWNNPTHSMTYTPQKIKLPTQTLLLFLVIILAACSSSGNSPAQVVTEETEKPVAPTQTNLIPSPTALPTELPTATIVRTPPELPLPFQTNLLNPVDYPHTYIQDACQYLRMKWDPNNSSPGTVVMVIMFHSIMKDGNPDANGILAGAFRRSMQDLYDQGFVAINMDQFVSFMVSNDKIPERAVLLIADDRHFAQYFENHFYPLYEQWGWPVVNAWISSPNQTYNLETGLGVWEENENLAQQGWVDYQAHGVVHYPILESSTDDYIASELFGSISFIQEKFGKTPQAFIWPGGNFTQRSIEMARQAGYQVGFTVNPRGPVMFNWVPLSDSADPARPSYLHEGHLNDPLMVIPRYWPSQIQEEVDNVRVIGTQAAEYAQAHKASELEFYDIVCAPTLGPIPELNP